jgi:hypothetical protein
LQDLAAKDASTTLAEAGTSIQQARQRSSKPDMGSCFAGPIATSLSTTLVEEHVDIAHPSCKHVSTAAHIYATALQDLAANLWHPALELCAAALWHWSSLVKCSCVNAAGSASAHQSTSAGCSHVQASLLRYAVKNCCYTNAAGSASAHQSTSAGPLHISVFTALFNALVQESSAAVSSVLGLQSQTCSALYCIVMSTQLAQQALTSAPLLAAATCKLNP